MLTRLVEPSHAKCDSCWNPKEDYGGGDHDQQESDMPQKEFPTGALPRYPTFADLAFLREHTVEQDEAHDAAHVEHYDHENEADDHSNGNSAASAAGSR